MRILPVSVSFWAITLDSRCSSSFLAPDAESMSGLQTKAGSAALLARRREVGASGRAEVEDSLFELCPLEDIKLLGGDCRPVDVSSCRILRPVSVLGGAVDVVFGIVE